MLSHTPCVGIHEQHNSSAPSTTLGEWHMTTYYTADKIFTGQDETTFATAFAVEDGHFTWVGEARDLPSGVDVVVLNGPVLPGFLDVHTHATLVANFVNAVACTVPVVTDIPSLIAALRAHPNTGAGASTWIEGWGYDESKLAEHRTPTRHDLDLVSTTQPVYVQRSDCHSGICNTRALELAGIDASTPDPEGAAFGREADGVTPNGILIEHGANQRVLQAKGSAGFDADARALAATTRHFAERGIVGITDMFCIPTRYDHRDLFRAAQQGGLRQSARIYYDFATIQVHPIRPIIEQDKVGRVAVAGIKLFADGAISNRTGWMRTPYKGSSNECGMSTAPTSLMQAALSYAREYGLQIAFHAMGDRAIESLVDFFGDLDPWLTDVPSVRIEHASIMDPALIQRIHEARMNFGVVTNVDFLYAEYDSYSENLTESQLACAYPVRDEFDVLENLALASDCPATTWADPDDVFMSIHAAVNRTAYNGAPINHAQAITVEQAVLLYTGKARTLLDFPQLGSIEPGKEASFITVSQDIFSEPTELIKDTVVTNTWIQGDSIYCRA